jgi:hypothetical protein
VSAAAAMAVSVVDEQLPKVKQVVLRGLSDPGTRLPEIEKLLPAQGFARIAREQGLSARGRMVGRSWTIAAILLAVLLGIAGALLKPLAQPKETSLASVTSLSVWLAAGVCALIGLLMPTINAVVKPGRRTTELQALAADLDNLQESKPQEFQGFAEKLAASLGERHRDRVVVVDHFERLDPVTKATIRQYLVHVPKAETSCIDYWFIAESAASGELSKELSEERHLDTRIRVLSQEPLTAQERAALARRIGHPERAANTAVGEICQTSASYTKTLRSIIETRRAHGDGPRRYDSVDLFALLSTTSAIPSGGTTLHRDQVLGWLTGREPATAALVRCALRGFEGDADEVANVLDKVLAEYSAFVETDSETSFTIPREVAAAFASLANVVALPDPSVCHALWAVWTTTLTRYRAFDAYWIGRVAEHLKPAAFRVDPEETPDVHERVRTVKGQLLLNCLAGCLAAGLIGHLDDLATRVGRAATHLPADRLDAPSEAIWAAALLRQDKGSMDPYLRAEAALTEVLQGGSPSAENSALPAELSPSESEAVLDVYLQTLALTAGAEELRVPGSLSRASALVGQLHLSLVADFIGAVFPSDPDAKIAEEFVGWYQLTSGVTRMLLRDIRDSPAAEATTPARALLLSVIRASVIWEAAVRFARPAGRSPVSNHFLSLSEDELGAHLAGSAITRETIAALGGVTKVGQLLRERAELLTNADLPALLLSASENIIGGHGAPPHPSVTARLMRYEELLSVAAGALVCSKRARPDEHEALLNVAEKALAALAVTSSTTGDREYALALLVDRYFDVLGMAWHVLGADGQAWRTRLKQVRFRAFTGVRSNPSQSRAERSSDAMELSRNSSGLVAAMSAAVAADLTEEDSEDLAARIYLNMALASTKLGLGEKLSTNLCVATMGLATAYAIDLSAVIQYLLDPGLDGKQRLTRVFETSSPAMLSSVILSFGNATLKDDAQHAQAMRLAREVVDERPQDEWAEEARLTIEVQETQRRLRAKELTPRSVYNSWNERLGTYPFVLYLILHSLTQVDDEIASRATEVLSAVPARDVDSSHVYAALELCRLGGADDRPDLVSVGERVLADGWPSLKRELPIRKNIEVLEILSRSNSADSRRYSQELTHWVAKLVVEEDLGRLATMLARGDFFSTFEYYCRVLFHFGLSATSKSLDAVKSSERPAKTAADALAAWLAEGEPTLDVLVRDPSTGLLKVDIVFLLIGQALFDGEAAGNAELDLSRERINAMAQAALPVLLERALELNLPDPLRDVMRRQLSPAPA